MNCTPKVGYPLQPTKVQFFMTQYTLNIKPYSITCAYAADSAPDHYSISRIHLRCQRTAYRKGSIRALERPKQFEFKETESCGIQNPAYANRLNWLL